MLRGERLVTASEEECDARADERPHRSGDGPAAVQAEGDDRDGCRGEDGDRACAAGQEMDVDEEEGEHEVGGLGLEPHHGDPSEGESEEPEPHRERRAGSAADRAAGAVEEEPCQSEDHDHCPRGSWREDRTDDDERREARDEDVEAGAHTHEDGRERGRWHVDRHYADRVAWRIVRTMDGGVRRSSPGGPSRGR